MLFKLIPVLLISVFGTIGFAVENQPPTLSVGDNAPTFYLKDLNNNDVFLRNYCGEKLRQPWKNKEKQVVILSFWATWCAPCQKEIPVLEEVVAQFKNENLKVFLIDVGEKPEVVSKFIDDKKYSFPVLMDIYNVVTDKKYKVNSLPRLFVIDQNGIIQKINKGFEDKVSFKADLTNILNTLLHK